MPKVIKVSLNTESINQAIKELEAYKTWVNQKAKELTEKLAMIGAKEASIRFGSAYYTGDNDAYVTVEPIPNGWEIRADGESVCFIEFGAGVYYNGEEPYPNPRPSGVVGIGQYGKGKGKQNTWGYYDDSDQLVLTHGTPAAMPMYHASKEMRQEILKIAREVFR